MLKDHLKGKLKAESSQFNPFVGSSKYDEL